MKKVYEKPEIEIHGDLKIITKGGPVGGSDEFGSMPS
jgi:hypothetical protein